MLLLPACHLLLFALCTSPASVSVSPIDEASADLAIEQGDLEGALIEYQGMLEGPLDRVTRRRVLGKISDARRQLGFRLRLLLAIEEGQLDAVTLNGKEGRPLSGDGGGVMVSGAGTVEYVRWSQAAVSELVALFEQLEADPAAHLDFAAFCFANGLPARGDQALVRAAEQADLKPEIDGILARSRGLADAPDAGFVVVDGRWISLDEHAKRKKAGSLADLSDQARDRRPERRREAWQMLSEKEAGRPILAAVLNELLTAKLADITEAKEMRSLELLIEDRVLLEERRAHALELIFDVERYTKDKGYKIYQEAQKEVELRVDAVEELWSSRKRARQVKLGSPFRRDVIEARELVAAFQQFGIPEPDLGEASIWKHLDPNVRVLSVQNLARDAAEAKSIQFELQLIASNSLVEGPKDPERDQVRITNEYRRMMGRRVLALDARLLESALGHSEEMSLLGYFSHTSPTPGRETMGKRARLAGYPAGAGENIYNGSGSAQAAHDAWFRSPGHHRNILDPRHTAMGSGLGGGKWTQNFGVAKVEL